MGKQKLRSSISWKVKTTWPKVSFKNINEYRRLYNGRHGDFYKKLEGLFLPDGYSLYKLLETYTPYHSMSNGFGFLTAPKHKLAYQFIEKAKKYLPKN